MKISRKIALGMIATLGIAASAAVLANEYGPMMDHGHKGFGPMGHCRNGGAEAHLNKLKTELKLTAAQEPVWNTFEKTVQAQMGKHPRPQKMAEGTDPMQAHIAFMEQRLAGMKAIQKARADLYQVLTPEQKAIFDKHQQPYHHRHG